MHFQPVSGLVLCALLVPELPAQYEFHHSSESHSSWTTVDGLPQNSVSGISQDAAGYLWIATYGGLARFDGSHFEVLDLVSRPDLPANRFAHVLVARDATMWLWTHEVGLLRYRDDRFTHLETPGMLGQFAEDLQGRIWGAFAGGVGLILEDRVELVREGEFWAILAASDGSIWASAKGQLLRHESDHDRVLEENVGLPPHVIFKALIEDDDGVVWCGGAPGVWRATDATNTEFEEVEGAPKYVQAMACDERGDLWFGCSDRLVRWDHHTDSATEIVEGSFVSFLVDERGNLWVGSLGGGLHCLRHAVLQDMTASLGLTASNTWAITEDSSGALLILSTRILTRIQDGRVERFTFKRNLMSEFIDRHGDLWLGTPGGLIWLSGDQETRYGNEAGLAGSVRAMLERRDGTFLIGTSTGLHRRDGDRFLPVNPGQLTGIRCLLEDETSGALWVGAEEGLALIEGDSCTWFVAEDGLSPGAVRALHLDSEDVLWAGSYGGGLSRIEDGEIVRYSRSNGLADNFISCILEDDDERLWINSNSGPFVVHRSELNRVASGEADRIACTSFTRGEGAREANGGSQPAGWRTADGRMWFPTIEGVTLADPKELPLDEAPPKVLIESLTIDSSREFDARFTALGFSSPERVRIQTRLIGQDPSWIEDHGERRVRYSYLRPGDYEFQVRARNGYGPWSTVLSQSFSIEARFHETTAFLIGIALLGALGAFGLAEFRLKRSRARTAALVQLVEERERAESSLSRSRSELRRLSRELLLKQEAERRHLSRELHDDLSQRLAALAIQAEIAESRLEDSVDRTRNRLHDIVEMTQQLAGDVQQLSRRLHPVGLRTLGLAEAIRQECSAFTRRGGVDIEIEENVASDEIPEKTAIAAFRILQESLHNIEKHARASGVEVRVVMEGDDLIVSISDHGQGFDIENGADVGLGLVTMRERAASIGAQLSIVSRPGGGTTVCLRAPERRNRE
jgi:signal transduction histidine kinase/ligand-binding sensor domain-containing protein